MTPSQLSIIVSSKGVADATVELDKLAKAAASVDAETKSFVIAQSKLAESNKKVSQSSEATARGVTTQELAMIKLHEAANKMNAAYIKQEEAQKKLINGSIEKALKEQADAAAKVAKAQEKLEKSELAAKLREQTKEAAAAKKEMEALAREADKLAKAQDKITKSTLNAEMRAQEKAMKATARAAAELEKAHGDALEMNKKITAQRVAASAKESSANQLNARGITDYQLSIVKAHEAANKMNEVIDKKNKRLKEQADNLKNASHHGNIFNNTLRSMATAALAYMGVNFFAGIVKDADAWAMMQAKLNLAVGGMQMAKIAQKDLYEMSQRVRVPLEDSAKLFTRMSVPLQRMGQSVGEVQKVVESFSMALKLGGATGQEASSAMLQLSQSFNAGRLNGGEFNSVAEAAPSVLRAVEVELIRVGKGADLAKYGLKELAAKGVLSTEIMAEALKRAAPKWKEEFEQLPLTVDGAITRIKNAWLKAIGEMGQDTKFNEELAKTLSKLEAELPRIANAIGKAMLFIVDNGEALLKTLGAIVALFAASKVIEASYTFIKLAESIGLVTAAGNLLGLTPIGRIIIGISAVVGAGLLVWKNYSDKLEDVTKKQEEYSKAIPDLIARLEGETRAIAKKNEVLDTELAIRTELERFNGKAPAKEIQMTDLSEYKQILANVNLARMRMDDAKKAFASRKSNEMGSTLEAEVKATTEAFKKAEALMKNPDTFKKFKLAELDRETSAILAAGEARDKASKELIEKYKSSGDKAKALRDAAIATLNTQYSKELELQNKNLITSEAYYAAKRGIEREYLESLDKQKKAPKEASGMFINQGKDDLFADTDKRIVEFTKAQEKAVKASAESRKAAEDEVEKVKALIAGYHDKKQALIDLQISEQETKQKSIDKNIASKEEIDNIDKTVEALKKLKREQATLSAMDADKKLLADMWDTTKIDKFESSSSKALKGVAKGFVDVVKAMDKYKAAQSLIAERTKANERTNRSTAEGELEYLKNKDEIQRKSDEYQINAYASMADAAKNFFNEGTKGYQALDAVSKVFHAAQMARTAMETMGLAVKGVANQAGGDVYSAIPRMAAMAAIMAGLGYATGMFGSSGGGGAKAADVQKIQASGSVFGDADAKSESITKSLELLKSSYDKLYPVNQGMLKALKNIESSMSGLTNLVVRSGGIVEGSNLGIQEGTVSKSSMSWTTALILGGVTAPILKLLGGLWGKTTQNIVDSGLQFGGSLQGMKQGQGFSQYASVDTTKSSWFGLKKDTSNTVQTQGLSNELNNQFSLIFTNMQTTLEEAGKVLYGSSKGVTDALNNMVFEVSKVSLKGLSGQALTDAINGVISKALDQMAGTAFANLEQFRQVGEGYAQTVIRVANTFSVVNATFDKLGMKLYAMDDAGIKAAMSFSELFDSMEEMQSVASSYYDNFYTEQEKQAKITEALRKQFAEMNLTLPTTSLAYRELVDNTTDPAKIATLWKLSDAFAEVFGTVESGVGGLKDIPQSMRDAFEALAESAERWLNLSKSAADLRGSINEILTGASDNSAKKAEKLWKMLESDISVEQKMSIAGELKDTILAKYQVERDSITKLLDLSRQLKNFVEGLKVGSMSPLTTTQKLEEAKKQYESILAKAKGGDTTAQGALQGSATTYLDLARTALASGTEYRTIFDEITTSLDMFSVDTQTAEERMVELNKSQEIELMKLVSQLNTIESVADSYYKTNIAEMTKQLTVMQEMYIKLGNLDGIAVDLAKLPAEIAAVLAGKFGRTTGEQFIEGLYKQYTGKSAQEIDKQGMEYWTEELLKYGRDYTLKAFVDSVKPPPPVVSKPSDTTTILTNTVVQLKEEISALRDDQNKQTEALIAATVISNQENATEVVEGVDDAYNKKNWRDVNAPALV